MKAKSKTQRRAGLDALSVMKKEQDKSILKGASKLMFETMSQEELVEMTKPRKASRRLT